MPFRCKCYKILVRWYLRTLKTVTKPDMIARDWNFVPVNVNENVISEFFRRFSKEDLTF